VAINAPLATAPVSITFPLNQSGKQIGDVLNAHASRLDTDETNIAANTIQGNNNASAISTLQGQMTTANNNISTLQSQMTTANTNINQLQTNVSTLQSQMSTANANISKNASDILALQNRMTTAETNITNNANAITAIQNQITTINNTLTSLQTQIDAINTSLSDLDSRIATNETNIQSIVSHDNDQDQAIYDLTNRVTALEQGTVVPPEQGGPFIGDLVHVKDASGHCQPSIVYEDWDGKNANGTISVAVLSPVRLSESPWDSYIEVHSSNFSGDLPFTAWHWPEMAFQYRRDLLRRIATHGILR